MTIKEIILDKFGSLWTLAKDRNGKTIHVDVTDKVVKLAQFLYHEGKDKYKR